MLKVDLNELGNQTFKTPEEFINFITRKKQKELSTFEYAVFKRMSNIDKIRFKENTSKGDMFLVKILFKESIDFINKIPEIARRYYGYADDIYEVYGFYDNLIENFFDKNQKEILKFINS